MLLEVLVGLVIVMLFAGAILSVMLDSAKMEDRSKGVLAGIFSLQRIDSMRKIGLGTFFRKNRTLKDIKLLHVTNDGYLKQYLLSVPGETTNIHIKVYQYE